MSERLQTRRQGLGEVGGAMVEFAIVAPVMVMLVLFADFFHDAVKTKLKAQEAARFLAWEFTSMPLSDYNSFHHSGLFNSAKTKITTDLKEKYQNFDSSNPSPTPNISANATFIATHTLDIAPADTGASDGNVPLDSQKTLSQIPVIGGLANSLISGGLDIVGPKPFKFNMNGMATGKVTVRFQNKILPAGFLDNQYQTQMVPSKLAQFDMSDTVSLVADPWVLSDGRDARLNPNQNGFALAGSTSAIHPFAREVNQMLFAGAIQRLIPTNVTSTLAQVENFVPGLPDPLFLSGPPVAAINLTRKAASSGYDKCSYGNTPKDGKVNLRDQNPFDEDIGQFCFYTIPFRWLNSPTDTDPGKVFERSGTFYMGCKTDQAIVDPLDPSYNCH